MFTKFEIRTKLSMFRRKKTPDIFERLENEAADELHLLDELGPKQFGTDHLMELHAQVCARINAQQRLQRIALSVGATGVGWLFLGMLSLILEHQLPAFIAFGLSTLCLSAFLALLLYSSRKYQTKGHLDHTRLSIEDELRSRRDVQRKHMEDW